MPHYFFQKKITKTMIIKKPKNITARAWEKNCRDFIRLLITLFFCCNSWKNQQAFYDFLVGPIFSERLSIHREMFGLTHLTYALNCYCNDFHQKYRVSFYMISFNELLKGITILSQTFCKPQKFICNMWYMMYDVTELTFCQI